MKPPSNAVYLIGGVIDSRVSHDLHQLFHWNYQQPVANQLINRIGMSHTPYAMGAYRHTSILVIEASME